MGYDALEVVLAGKVEHSVAIDVGPVRRDLYPRPGEAERVEFGPPLGVRQRGGGAAVERDDVEQVEGHRHIGAQGGRGPKHVHAALESAEGGPALRVEGDDLAVEDRVAAIEDIDERVDQLGERGGDVVAVSAEQVAGTGPDLGDCPLAVPLQLPCPALALRKLAERGQHRGGHRRRRGHTPSVRESP